MTNDAIRLDKDCLVLICYKSNTLPCLLQFPHPSLCYTGTCESHSSRSPVSSLEPRREGVLMETFEAIQTVLAVRQFKDTPIPDPIVRHIVEAGRLTASGGNSQPWHFIVV